MEFNSIKEIFASIDQIRLKLVGAVSHLSDEAACFQPAPDKWSAALLIEHLAKTEEMLLGLTQKLLEKAEAENIASDGTITPPVSFAEIGQRAAGAKFEAPEAIRPVGAATLAESLAKLEESRRSLAALRPRLEAVDLSKVQFPHPAFGRMNLYYWLAFIGLHEARHLRQISDVLAALPKN